MDNINLYLTNMDDNLDNLISDEIQAYIGDYKKFNIFNQNITSQIQKIWLLTPKLKMLGKIYIPSKTKQIALFSFVLYELNQEIRKFKDFILLIEEKVSNILGDLGYENMTLKSCVKTSNNFYPSLTISSPFTKNNDEIKFGFDTYDINNQKIQCYDIDSGSFLRTYIELSDVWISATEYGINWRIMQMKSYPEFDFHKCLFSDGPVNEYRFIDTSPQVINKGIPPPPPQIPKKINNETLTKKINNMEPQPISFIDELRMKQTQGQIKLKHVIPVEKNLLTHLFHKDDILNDISKIINENNIEPEIIEPEIIEPEIIEPEIIEPEIKIPKKKKKKRIIKKNDQ